MKRYLLLLVVFSAVSGGIHSQDNQSAPAPDPILEPAKFRFGLRVNPQITWLASKDKNIAPDGARPGFGFGLNLEFRLNNVTALLTGIGGDFEGGKYTFRSDSAYQVVYWLDDSKEIVKPGAENLDKSTLHYISARTVKNTFVTIPLVLKLSTKEIGMMRYFGMFGTEIGVRVKSLANDTYYATGKYDSNDVLIVTPTTEFTEEDININKESTLIPLRLGLNVGLGAEYRLSGSTALFFSANYFYSFTNLMKKEADYTYYKTTSDNMYSNNFKFIKQSLIYSAVRINVGIMF